MNDTSNRIIELEFKKNSVIEVINGVPKIKEDDEVFKFYFTSFKKSYNIFKTLTGKDFLTVLNQISKNKNNFEFISNTKLIEAIYASMWLKVSENSYEQSIKTANEFKNLDLNFDNIDNLRKILECATASLVSSYNDEKKR